MAGYLGAIPVPQATQNRESFTASANQTSFATAGYTVGFVDAFLNGVRLNTADFTATNGSDIVLASGAAVNDILDVISYATFEINAQTFTGTTTMTDVVAASLDISGNIDIDGVTNLDVVDIDGAVDMATTLAVAGNVDFNGDLDVDGTTNLDVVDIDGAVNMATTLLVTGNVDFNGDLDVDGTTNLDATNIVGATDINGTVTISPNTSGKDTFELSTSASNEARLRMKNVDNLNVEIRAGGNSYFKGGKFSIGTDTADTGTLLTVAGAVTFTGQNTAHGASRLKIGQDTTAISQIRFYGANTSTAGILQFTSSSSNASVGGERMRIDSSGNLLVGKSAAGFANVGTELAQSGFAFFTRDGGAPVQINRLGAADGALTEFYKGGSSIGNLSTIGGRLNIISNNGSSGGGLRLDSAIRPLDRLGAVTNGATDLGANTARFKDLYLGGGVFLGGTGAANKLEDYEIGIHGSNDGITNLIVPNTSGTVTMNYGVMGYTKIGRQVTLHGEITVGAVSSPVGGVTITLPFAQFNAANSNDRQAFTASKPGVYNINLPDHAQLVMLNNSDNLATAQLTFEQDNGTFLNYTPAAGDTLYIQHTYYTSV